MESEMRLDPQAVTTRFRTMSAYEDPRVALRQLPLDQPDVVLMDLQLPGLSGIECVAALRRQSPRDPRDHAHRVRAR